MSYTAVALMLIFLLLFLLLVETFLKEVILVKKIKEMRVLSEITETVLQMTLLIQSPSFTGQTRGSWGSSGCSCRKGAAARVAHLLSTRWKRDQLGQGAQAYPPLRSPWL